MKVTRRTISSVILLVLGIFLGTLGYSVYSAITTQHTSVGIKINSPKLEFFSDPGATQLLTDISFAPINQGAQTITVTGYVKNLGTGAVTIFWSSTLSSASPQIKDSWVWFTIYGCCQEFDNPLNGTYIQAGQILSTHYTIIVPQNVTLGNYSWDLTLGTI